MVSGYALAAVKRTVVLVLGVALLAVVVHGRLEQRPARNLLEAGHGHGRGQHHHHNRTVTNTPVKRLVNRTVWGDDPNELVKRDGTKYVFMHHIVGNTYPYTASDWEKDFREIQAKGVDALALNIGSSQWQEAQVATAYSVAQSIGTNFKLFFSFDFEEMPCTVDDIVRRINVFKDHPNQFKVNGKVFVSSYSGGCLGNGGWQNIKDRTNAYLMPFVYGLENQFGAWPSMDSWYCWGCAWPQGNNDKTTGDDEYYMNQLGSRYATTVSMWMYTNLASKSFYLRGDNWLINNRWEQLVAMRDRLSFVEMVTWNDYGESDYFGPIRGAQPAGTYWADEFPHTAWHDMSEYYIKAFKTGVYPAITQDVIYYWARPHPARATASSGGNRPTGYDWAEDFMWVAVFATAPGTVRLSCGSSTATFSIPAGVSKLKVPTAPGKMAVRLERSGAVLIDKTEQAFTFVNTPVRYNYNAFVGAATASGQATPTSSSAASSTSSSSSTSSTSSSTTSTAPTPTSTVIDGITWNYKGCYPDDTSSRTLFGGLFIRDNTENTRQKCLRRCATEGYKFGGVEYGVECFCSNEMRTDVALAAESSCSQACSGNANEKCGAGGRINVYDRVLPTATSSTPTSTVSATPTAETTSVNGVTWTYKGCYPDDSSARTLPDLYIMDFTANSRAKCLNTCQTRGYAFGGVEYGFECFCSNQIRAGVSPGSEDACSQSCSGNANEKCGAGGRINVWSRSSSDPVPSTTLPPGPTITGGFVHKGCVAEGTTGNHRALTAASYVRSDMTPQVCQGLCSNYNYLGVEYGSECYCGDTLSNGATGLAISEDRCNAQCSGDSSQRCGGGWTLDLYQKASVTWQNLGCYIDTPDRMLRGSHTWDEGLTIERCVAFCAEGGFAIAAAQYGRECYCGQEIVRSLGSQLGVKTGEEECSMPCAGNSAQKCGAGYRNNVYRLPSV